MRYLILIKYICVSFLLMLVVGGIVYLLKEIIGEAEGIYNPALIGGVIAIYTIVSGLIEINKLKE